MNMNKRHIPILYAILMAAALLAACSTAKKEETEQIINDVEIAEEEAEEVEKIVEKPRLHFSSAQQAMQYMDESEDHEAYAAGIFYKLATDSLDYCVRLLNNQFDHFIIVDKGKMKVELYDKFGRLKKAYRCACGRNYGNKRKKGDCRTPEGFFRAGSVSHSAHWHYTDENGKRSEKPGQYGPRFVRIITPNYSSMGIHGTDAPWSVGGRRSHGCVRILNENILELVEYVETGMPIIILPGKKDKEANWLDAHPTEEAADTLATQPKEIPAEETVPAAEDAQADGQHHGHHDTLPHNNKEKEL
mgnify:FL=1